MRPTAARPDTRGTSRLNACVFIVGWFSRSDGDKKRPEDGGLEEVPKIMDSMDSFKQAQRVGKTTGALVQELSASTVEGTAAEGKVKVVFDCQQKPVSLDIDEEYFKTVDLLDFTNALTAAMKEAHSKSTDKMDERLKSFYQEIGLG